MNISINALIDSKSIDIPQAVGDQNVYYVVKRLMDVLLSLLALIFFFPAFILIAIAIALDSRGPFIFVQERVGVKLNKSNERRNWEPIIFKCYKFRTMYHDADPCLHQNYIKAYIQKDEKGMAECQGKETQTRKLECDPRITQVGRILRKTSLDEIPQFWNILRGEMSLVGPRPAIPYEIAMYEPWHCKRLLGKPGLTGLWQVTARSSAEFDDMVRLDIEYLEKQSLWRDLIILLKTPFVVISCKGAH
jgi:lipopolysaccharide/colanic/teichoic acid biosynthesis glycosyltransferase